MILEKWRPRVIGRGYGSQIADVFPMKGQHAVTDWANELLARIGVDGRAQTSLAAQLRQPEGALQMRKAIEACQIWCDQKNREEELLSSPRYLAEMWGLSYDARGSA